MFFKDKPVKFPQRYYKALVVKEALGELRKEVPEGLLDKRMKVKLGTLDGIVASLLLTFADQKEKA
jgi:hypothetical protein